MKISDIEKNENFTLVQTQYENDEITSGYTSDMLSDVMANAEEDCVIITIQAHKNTVAVAKLVNAPAIIVCNGREIDEDMIESAKKENIAVFATEMNQFNTSVKIAELI